MRFVVVAGVLCPLIVGLGYTYSQETSVPTFLTAAVERGSISTLVKASGSVEAVVSVDVSSQLSGRIAEVFVNFNDAIKAGQPIAQIDQEIFAARVNEAKAALRVARATAQLQKAALQRATVAVTNARTAKKLAEAQSAANKARQDEVERDFRRKLELARTGSGTERDLSQMRALRDAGAADLRASLEQIQMKAEAIAIAEAEKRMAEANLENAQAVVEQRQAALDQARLDLDRTVLRAPIDGIIIKRDVNPGQTVAVSLEAKTLFKVANDLREMEVHGKIDEADVGQLKPGQATQFTVDAYPDRTFSGQVLQIRKAPEVVQNVVTYTTIVSAPNPDLLLLPGMTAQLRIVVSDSGGILKIPSQALRFRPSGAGAASGPQSANQAISSTASATVWLVGDDGRPNPVAVRLGASDETGAALLEGSLTEGQQVIIGVASAFALDFEMDFRMPPLLRTVGISKHYPSGETIIRAVSNVSLLIERGEFVAIRGRSGSGKSTLMNLLGLLERPDSGEYALKGREVAKLSEDTRAAIRSQELGFIFQLPALLPRATALENVELPLVYAGVARSERRRTAKDALDRVGLADRSHHWPNQLSGGEQQRVVIARAMVNDPALILADEPTGSLDSSTSDEILSLFEGLHRDGHTIIMVTHATDVADRARRQITLHDGRIVEDAVTSGNSSLPNAVTLDSSQ